MVKYQPEFISPEEEASLLSEIWKLPLEEAKYKAFTARRRIAIFGFAYDFDTNRLDPAPELPQFLFPLREKVGRWVGLEPGEFVHALVNEYRPGTPLGWHRDAPQFGVVVGVSLAAPCRMRFRSYPPRPKMKVFTLELEPRSAYLLRDEMRWRWQHSVSPTKALRYSITFRTLSDATGG